MALLVFDTHDFITKLSKSGMDPAQAKTVSEGLKAINLEHVATKSDIDERCREMLQMRASLLQWFTGMLIAQAALVAALVKLL